MSGAVSAIKTLVVPAVISLILFLVVSFLVVPVWRRYRNRYSQYLPLDSISDQTSSLRHRITSRLASLALPSTWRRDRGVVFGGGATSHHDDLDDGEELNDVDQNTWGGSERQARAGGPDSSRRLSRDLEEGFMDDSDDSDDSDD